MCLDVGDISYKWLEKDYGFVRCVSINQMQVFYLEFGPMTISQVCTHYYFFVYMGLIVYYTKSEGQMKCVDEQKRR